MAAGVEPTLTCPIVHTFPMGCLTWAENPREPAGVGQQHLSGHSCTVVGPCRESSDHQSKLRFVLAHLSFPGQSACLGTAFLLELSSPSFSGPFSRQFSCSQDTPGVTFNQYFPCYLHLAFYITWSQLSCFILCAWYEQKHYNFKTPKIFILLFQHKRFHLSF